MSSFSTDAKNTMLDALSPTRIRLHNQNPGASGLVGQLGSGPTTVVFSAAASGARALSADVDFTGLGENATVTWFSVLSSTDFLGRGEITSGDLQANAAGQYTLTTATTLQLNDPA